MCWHCRIFITYIWINARWWEDHKYQGRAGSAVPPTLANTPNISAASVVSTMWPLAVPCPSGSSSGVIYLRRDIRDKLVRGCIHYPALVGFYWKLHLKLPLRPLLSGLGWSPTLRHDQQTPVPPAAPPLSRPPPPHRPPHLPRDDAEPAAAGPRHRLGVRRAGRPRHPQAVRPRLRGVQEGGHRILHVR